MHIVVDSPTTLSQTMIALHRSVICWREAQTCRESISSVIIALQLQAFHASMKVPCSARTA